MLLSFGACNLHVTDKALLEDLAALDNICVAPEKTFISALSAVVAVYGFGILTLLKIA